MSIYGFIYYGEGDIFIEYSEPISAFDIKFDGIYELESYNPDNFLMNYNNGRLIGVGLGSTLGEDPFLKYTGDLRIKECKIVTSNMGIFSLSSKKIANDNFEKTRSKFSKNPAKFENLDRGGVIYRIPDKTKVNIITKNLYTDGGYLLDGLDYKGDYHLHHTGIAMTGSDHTEDSEILELKNKNIRIRKIKTVNKVIKSAAKITNDPSKPKPGEGKEQDKAGGGGARG